MSQQHQADPALLNGVANRLGDVESLQTDIMRQVSGLTAKVNQPTKLSGAQIQRITNQITENIVFQTNNGWVQLVTPTTVLSTGAVVGSSGTINAGTYVPSNAVAVRLAVQITGASKTLQLRQDSSYGYVTVAGTFTGDGGIAVLAECPLTSSLTFDYLVTATTCQIQIIGYIIKLSGIASPTGGGVVGVTTYAALSDVQISSIADAQIPIWNSGALKWQNQTLSGDLTINDTGVATLPSVITSGSGNDATKTWQLQWDAKGRLLVAAALSIAIATSQITSGQLAVARGGTGLDGSVTGGANQVVKQTSLGGAFTVGALVAADIPSLDASKITTGQLALARGGTNADLSATGGTSQVLKQVTAGAAITVGQLAASDLSNGTTGSGSVVLATSPTLVTPALGTPSSATLTNATGLPIAGIAGATVGRLPYDNGTVGAWLSPNTAATRKVLTSIGTGSAGQAPTLTDQIQGITLWNSTTAFVTGDIVVGSDGNYYRCIASSTNNDPTTDAYSKWELHKVTGNTTLNVNGTRFATSGTGIQNAIYFVSKATIDPAATVTIQLADATYTCSAAIIADMVNGANVNIVGNTGTPANVTLNFSSSTIGFRIGGPATGTTPRVGSQLGLIDGMKIVGTWTGSGSTGLSLTAIGAGNSSEVVVGSHVTIDKFYYAIQAAQFSIVRCSGITVTNGGDAGIFAYQGSYIFATSCTVSGCSDSTNNLGSGFVAEQGGYIDATSSTATTCRIAGFNCINGRMRVYSTTSNSNTGSGYRSVAGGAFEAGGTMSANSNGSDGIYLSDGSVFANYTGSTITCNSNTGNGVNLIAGSIANIVGLTASANTGAGIRCYSGSRINAGSATLGSSGNANANGIDAFGGAYVDLGGGGSVRFNTTTGILAQLGSFVYCTGATVTSNVGANFNPTVNTSGNQNSYIRQ